MKIKIDYDGKYPNLCRGSLVVTIDSKIWKFPGRCMQSGGHVWFDKNWLEHVESGPWNIREWPENFPTELKPAVLDAINSTISYGCCGGCI